MPVLQRRPRRLTEDEPSELEQRPRQRQRREEPADEPEDSNVDGSDDEDDAAEGTQRDKSTETQLVKKLVRYALACEYSRTPIRRDGIKEKVLGEHGRSFRKVFGRAQQQLRAVFGMEMVELPIRDKLTTQEKRKAVKSQGKGQASSNTYILVTTLPAKYRTADIIAPAKVQSAEDEAAFVALYTAVIAIITLNGGEISDSKLRRYLQRLNADKNTPVDTTENLLQRLIRQGYLVRAADKEARTEGEDEAIFWYVGARGKTEVEPGSVAGLVREVYGGSNEELEAKLEASLRVRKKPTSEAANGNGRDEDGGDGARGNGSRRTNGRETESEEEDEEEEEEE